MAPKKRKRDDRPLEKTYHSIDTVDQKLYNELNTTEKLAMIALRAKLRNDTHGKLHQLSLLLKEMLTAVH